MAYEYEQIMEKIPEPVVDTVNQIKNASTLTSTSSNQQEESQDTKFETVMEKVMEKVTDMKIKVQENMSVHQVECEDKSTTDYLATAYSLANNGFQLGPEQQLCLSTAQQLYQTNTSEN